MRVLPGIVDPLRREAANRLGQQMRVIGYFDALRNLRLRLLRRVDDWLLPFDERPLERFLDAVHVDALAVLPGDVKERANDARAEVAIAHFDVARLNGEGRVVLGDQLLANRA